MDKQTFFLVHDTARCRAIEAVRSALDGYVVQVRPKTRSLDQNAKFHTLCADIAKSGMLWMGKPRNEAAWKALLVSGHAVATNEGADVVPGLEGEFVNIRESTAAMSVRRGASLIEYTLAFCAANQIPTHSYRRLAGAEHEAQPA